MLSRSRRLWGSGGDTREGNEVLEEDDEKHATQDSEIEKLVWG